VPRRLPLIAAVALAAVLAGAGCADDVSPAVRIGDETISHDELMDEVAEWSESPKLVEVLTQGVAQPSTGPNHDMELVTAILSNRIIFDVFSAEFDRRGLELDPNVVEQISAGLIPSDPQASAQIQAELDPELYDSIVDALAKQDAVVSDLGADVDQFVEEAFADVEVSSRYGSFDAATGSVTPPEGPATPPNDLLIEL
jgi:hypothetical protein